MSTLSVEAARPATEHLLTGELFREVQTTDRSHDLVSVGLALHHFTEPLLEIVTIRPVDLHRATTILTKQTGSLLAANASLGAIRELMIDPDRVATVGGQSASELCADEWPSVRATADERATSAIEGARTFGEAAVLHLAATRAVRPQRLWWGTHGWTARIDEWLTATDAEPRLRSALLGAPEHLGDEILADIIGA